MTSRELVVLGTASQAPTRGRNHNGYLLRWDGEGLLFDPGEGTQRQMVHAGVSGADVTRICITHAHGDHCFGLPGVVHRLTLDQNPRQVPLHHPADDADPVRHLLAAAAWPGPAPVVPHPVTGAGEIARTDAGVLTAAPLRHRVATFGYRWQEPDRRTAVAEELARRGVRGPAVGRLVREGTVTTEAGTVRWEDVSVPRPGQGVAVVMDTAPCAAAVRLARGVDLLLVESTYLDADADLAEQHLHLTAGQAGRLAAEAGVRQLVLTHFSRRYPDPQAFVHEARRHFDGPVVAAADLMRVPVPPRGPRGGTGPTAQVQTVPSAGAVPAIR